MVLLEQILTMISVVKLLLYVTLISFPLTLLVSIIKDPQKRRKPQIGQTASSLISKSMSILKGPGRTNYGTKTLNILVFLSTEYKNNKSYYGPMLEHYEDTFQVIYTTLKDSQVNDLEWEPLIHIKIQELLEFVHTDFLRIYKLLEDNEALKKEMELKVLTQSLEQESTILKGIKKMYG